MRHLVELLESAGLADREARLYLTALSAGPATMQELSHASQMARSTTYGLIESLVSMGLMTSVETDGKRLFSAESPALLLQMISGRAFALSRAAALVEEALPELSALEKQDRRHPRLFMYEGVEGIRRLSERYEERAHEFVEVVPFDRLQSSLDDASFEAHRQRLVRQGVRGRLLLVARHPPVTYMHQLRVQYGWQARYLATDRSPISGHVSIKGDEIYGVTYDDQPVGVVIENAALAQTLWQVFDLAWTAAGEYPETHMMEDV